MKTLLPPVTPSVRGTIDADLPLCVDLDGTLIMTDILWESVAKLIKTRPASVLLIPLWLMKGKAHLKYQIARRVELDVTSLPYNKDLLLFLKQESTRGRRLILATATNILIAQRISDYLNIFSEVIASDERLNLSGPNKLRAIQARFGHQFAYAGNDPVDLTIWDHAAQAIVVNSKESLIKKVQQRKKIGKIFNRPTNSFAALIKEMRVQQWAKNLLIFVPLITAHKVGDAALVLQAIGGFVAFSLCASSAYILNDLMDLEADRHNLQKRFRPLADGRLSVRLGLAITPLLFAASLATTLLLPLAFLKIVALYFALTCAYSLYLKQLVLVDVITLAALYTLRIYAGSVAIGVTTSKWLLAFSMFVFLSLALIKRFSELYKTKNLKSQTLSGRDYRIEDLQHVSTMGVASGYIAVLVLALYISSQEVTALYSHPDVLWLICPLIFYWISRAWLLASRGCMHEDPIVFALWDKRSYLIALLIGAVLVLAL